MRISENTVLFHPDSGISEEMRSNPVPARAVKLTRAAGKSSIARPDAHQAADKAGVGVVDYDKVLAFSKGEIDDFVRHHDIKSLLSGNAKTNKERPSGRLGYIRGLSLAPHFYANMLSDMVGANDKLKPFNKTVFNSFNGASARLASEQTGVEERDLIDVCVGSSPACRMTCLVYSGQNPSTVEASRSKMKHTWAFLDNPALFIARLRREIIQKTKTASKEDIDFVVRLNMLSDVPWYVVCPDLLEECALEHGTAFYDYTKVPFWDVPKYQRVAKHLDLTFSYSGANTALCEEALQNGVRIAAAFAPADPDRPASIARRTTWQELLYLVGDGKPSINIFGGRWKLVDGDESDYRMDDPAPSIVALNFKQPNLRESVVPGITARMAAGRRSFAEPVADPHGKGLAHSMARGTQKAMWKEVDEDALYDLPLEDVLGLSEQFRARKQGLTRNPLQVLDDAEQQAAQQPLTMHELESNAGDVLALIGPHVPTVLND